MKTATLEASYSLGFRQKDVEVLEEHLRLRHSVELIGMKRVGINNFLRFFLLHKNNHQDPANLYIMVDLNALIEREIFPFWRLTFKRITDAVNNADIDSKIKSKISHLFDVSIQSGDLFLTYDGVRESLHILGEEGINPTIFLTRFDRLQDVITPEFFDNLQSLKDASDHKLSYVFTTFRELEHLSPEIFHHKSLSNFSQTHYMRPATDKDMEIILATFEKKYDITIESELRKKMIDLSGGHVQYLQLTSIIYYEMTKRGASSQEFLNNFIEDERITLLSEELWESLSNDEQHVLKKVWQEEPINIEERQKAKYLWDTGFIEENGTKKVFSELFAHYLQYIIKENQSVSVHDFTKKEYMLFNFLKEHVDTVCERDTIIEIVWPEYRELGVSDWSVDKLVARVRNKLKKQNSPFQIITIKTRGYKLVSTQ